MIQLPRLSDRTGYKIILEEAFGLKAGSAITTRTKKKGQKNWSNSVHRNGNFFQKLILDDEYRCMYQIIDEKPITYFVNRATERAIEIRLEP